MKQKINCCKCSCKAVWMYMPISCIPDDERYYCEEHVSRGCSCNIIELCNPEATEQFTDEQGRLLPCCEYDYCEEGYTEEVDPFERWQDYDIEE